MTIITSQFSLDEIMDRAAGEKFARCVEAIVRRLDDRCHVVEFSPEADEEYKKLLIVEDEP